MRFKKISSTLLGLLLSGVALAQYNDSDHEYKKPLKQVLTEIQDRFHVRVKYSEDMVKDRWVPYADWRYKPTAAKTLAAVLAPLDMKVNEEGPNAFKLKYFEYSRITPEEGREKLAYLASQYHDLAGWEKRKAELKPCMYEALKLSPMPAKPASKPIITNKRVMDGYTIENIAIETLPGLYICGSLYQPLKAKGKIPVVLCPDGHFGDGRYRADEQYRCATLARMGAMAISYDLFAWGESLLQFKDEDHRRSLAMTIQALNSFRILDYLLTLKNADSKRVAITGASGGGSHTMLMTALDDRIKVSVPVVMLSSYFSGGCPCESGMPVHLCGGGTNNDELAAMAAPRPQLVISDGKDWSANVPDTDLPYLKNIYGYYGKTELVQNAHFPTEGHDYGKSKRMAMYDFMAQHLNLNINTVKGTDGKVDESKVTIEKYPAMYVFGEKGERLPSNAIHGFEQLEKIFAAAAQNNTASTH
ncbi:acetylxylan esterase [Mucilaginibacter sp. Bleaf8]|uniref:alpha/beta hydrolase family protein n=1 Tax=Mucilaginibacter sp. Bleaf8 TaxID=2834430 RepID=UPI001BCB2001|nr:acetylxylan esterase [Mucilaginibacter sp. Bleaf8]MBS7564907.1 acetylxylan esterase [Mucilaginibacter sp. Bleaf8]